MPLNQFDGDTFVAFIDISGFKELMKNEQKALRALDVFYNTGYNQLRNQPEIQGLFISDCGILFGTNTEDNLKSLKALLSVIKGINIRMRDQDFMTTTSIVYGGFKYETRIEFAGIGKYPIYGNAYVSAFLDNENGTPKIQPGQCRILKDSLPFNMADLNNDPALSFLKEEGSKYYYYYWMVNNNNEIEAFKENYQDAYNLKYAGMLRALKG